MIIECLKNKKGQWFWRMKARNGKILAHSESYSSWLKCWRAVERLIPQMRKFNWFHDLKCSGPFKAAAKHRLEKYFQNMKGPITE